MLSLALVIALVASAAAEHSHSASTGYIDGHEYVYRYSGVMYTTYPHVKPQEAGYAYAVKLTVQPNGDTAVFQVSDASKAQFNGEFEDVTKAHHDFHELPPHAEFLTRPFRVTRKNGIVTKFETTNDEPSFSVNLKRGIVSLFNLNFEQTVHPEDNEIAKPDPEAHYYKVMEESALGECETAYVIEHHPHDREHNIVLNVTKVRNFHKCNTRPNQVYSVFHGHPCGEAEHEKPHTLHGNGQYHYSIRGDRHHYVIEKIKSASETAYTPYPLEGESVVTVVKRNLELIEEHPVVNAIAVPGDMHAYTSLVYEFDFQKDFKEPVDLKKPHYLYHLTGRKVPISDIRKQVEELVEVYHDDTYHEKIKDKDFPGKFVELLRSVATLGYDEIEDLYKTYADIPATGATEQQKRYRGLFVDTLVNLGTNPAFLFGKYLLENKKFRPKESEYFLTQLQFHLKEVSEVLLEELEEICEHEKKNPHLHLTCVNTLSNIVHDHCVAHYHPEDIDVKTSANKQHCSFEDAVKHHNYIAHLYEVTTNDKLKVAYIKALGNIGLREIIPLVKPYVEGHGNQHLYYRDNAIWALRHVGHRFPEKVKHLLVPLLFNRTENYQLRLASFILLLKFHPELYEIEGLARSLKHDPDDQVRSFVYSTFQHLANSTHPCDAKVSKDAHYALRILEDVHHEFDHYDYSFSKHHYYAGYDHDYDFGGSTRFAYFASDTGYIPRKAYLAFEDLIGGKSHQTFGMGFKQFGLEKFVDKFLGPEGSFGKRSLFDLFKKKSKRDTSSTKKELNEIKSHVHLPVHDYEHIHGEFFFKYMGNYLSTFQFDDKTFEQFFKEGRFTIPNIPAAYENIAEYHYQRFMLTVDKFYVLPGESGIPIIFDYKQPIYYYHHNKESSFKVEPGFFAEEREGHFPDHVKVHHDGHFAMDKNLYAFMGAVIPFDQVIFGAGINRRVTVSLPLKFDIDFDVKEKKLKTHWTPVAPHEVYHFKYEPFTFVDSYANSVPMDHEPGYKAVRRAHNHEIQKHFWHDTLGVGFDVKADYENEFNDFGSWVDFFLEKDYREKFYYLYANPRFEPYHIDVEFSKADHDATNDVETELIYEPHDEDWIIPHFPEEHFVDYDDQKDQRKHLSTCVFKFNLKTHGDKERKIHSVLSWTKDLFRTFHKVNFYYERTPFASSEHEDKKICASSYLKYPDYDLAKFATLDTVDIDHTVKSELKVHFGKNCDSDQKFKIVGLMAETEEQHQYELHREDKDTAEHYNAYSHHYHECLEERKGGVNYGQGCMDYYDLITTLHKYTFHIKHEHLSNEFLNKTYLLDRILKFALYTHSDHNEIDVHNPVDEVHIEANFSSHLPVADIRVQKPTSNSNYYNVYSPHYHGFSSYPDFEEIHVKNSFSDIHCHVEGDHVSTFDNYEYTLPSIDCYKVISRDCSPREYFTVLASKIKHTKYHKALKVFLGDHKIEALPVTEDSELIIRVDGKRVPVTDDEPYLHKEKDDDHTPLFYVTHRDFYYALHSEKYGLIVEFDGHAVFVQASPYYRSKLCGLCGNYNGQKHDGDLTPEGCHYRDVNDFAYSYTVREEGCSVPEPNHICPHEGGFGCTRLRTKVLQLNTGKIPQTCFSTVPVSECSAHCKSPGTVSRKLSFHCLPTKDDSTKALLQEQDNRVLYEVSRKSKDHEAIVEVPVGCFRGD